MGIRTIDSKFLREHGIIYKKDLPVKLLGISLGPKTRSDKIDLTPLKGLSLAVHSASRSVSGLLKEQGMNIKIISYRKRLSKMQRNKAEQKINKKEFKDEKGSK